MPELTVRPRTGSQQFRQNASLSVENGELIVTDSKAVCHRFTLDKENGGPALFCTYTVAVSRGSAPEQALADSHRLAIVRTHPDLWDQNELERFAKALTLVVSDSLPDAPTNHRDDCVDLFGVDGTGRQFILWTSIILVAAAVAMFGIKTIR